MDKTENKTVSSVLVVKLSAMGDIVHTFPVVRAIKKAMPEARVDWIVGDSYTELVRLSPYVDNVIPFRRKEWARWRPETARQIMDFVSVSREREYGAVIDLQGLLRSGLITGVARAPVKIGFSYAREGAPIFYNRKVPSPAPDAHAIDRYMAALPELGITGADVGYDLAVPAEAMARADEVAKEGPYAVINPNARWETKRWPAPKFGELAKELDRRYGLRSVIIGGPEDAERGRAVAKIAGSGAVDLTGKGGFAYLAAILKNASVMFTNDSGPMHLAVALGTPVVAVFGPTNPAKTGPYGEGNAALLAPVECAPCYKRRCPANLECMMRVETADLLSAWEKLKDGARAG